MKSRIYNFGDKNHSNNLYLQSQMSTNDTSYGVFNVGRTKLFYFSQKAFFKTEFRKLVLNALIGCGLGLMIAFSSVGLNIATIPSEVFYVLGVVAALIFIVNKTAAVLIDFNHARFCHIVAINEKLYLRKWAYNTEDNQSMFLLIPLEEIKSTLSAPFGITITGPFTGYYLSAGEHDIKDANTIQFDSLFIPKWFDDASWDDISKAINFVYKQTVTENTIQVEGYTPALVFKDVPDYEGFEEQLEYLDMQEINCDSFMDITTVVSFIKSTIVYSSCLLGLILSIFSFFV